MDGANANFLVFDTEMKGTILLNHDENVKQVEDEEKTRFLRSMLEQMGLPIQDFWTSDTSLNVDQRMKLRNILGTYGILVVDDLDGGMQVYVEGEKVAEWHKCTYKLKRDLRQLDPRKQFYMEMEIDCWSLFEEQEAPQE